MTVEASRGRLHGCAMNKLPFHPLRSTVLFVCASAFSLANSFAEVLVDWGGNYVSSSQIYSNTAYPADFRAEGMYSTVRGPNLWYNGTVANLTPSSGYLAPLGKSSTFYGGWSASSGDAPAVPGGEEGNVSGLNSRVVLQNGPGGQPGQDAIYLATNNTAPAFRGLIVFDKSDFLNDMNEPTVGFDGSSSLSFTGFVGGYRANIRWVVQDNDNWYISDASFTGSGASDFWGAVASSTLNDPNNQLWVSYTPILSDSAGPYLYNAAPGSGYATHTFSNIQSVGVYFDSYGVPSSGDGTYTNFGLQQFTVNGIAVPEPGTFALAGLALAGLAVLRRRKA